MKVRFARFARDGIFVDNGEEETLRRRRENGTRAITIRQTRAERDYRLRATGIVRAVVTNRAED